MVKDDFNSPEKSTRGVKYITHALRSVWTEYQTTRKNYIGQLQSYLMECPPGSTLDLLLCMEVHEVKDWTDYQTQVCENYGKTKIEALGTQCAKTLLEVVRGGGLRDLPPRLSRDETLTQYIYRIFDRLLIEHYTQQCVEVIKLASSYRASPQDVKYLEALKNMFSGQFTKEDLDLVKQINQSSEWLKWLKLLSTWRGTIRK